MHNYERLEIVKRARRIRDLVYEVTSSFPSEEKYVLVSQMRRAAHSIGANLAEGAGRITKGEFRQFVSNATGSTFELEWHASSSLDLHYMSEAQHAQLARELDIEKRALYRFAETLR